MGKMIEMVGKRFNHLVVIGLGIKPVGVKSRETYWLCRCDCGKEKSIMGGHIRTGRIKSCGCYNSRIVTYRNHENHLEYGEANINRLLVQYIDGSRNRGVSFSLDRNTFKKLIFGRCYYCNREPFNKYKCPSKHYGDVIYNGIDRLDSSKGYVEGNVVSCCKICNYAKRIMTEQEFYEWISSVYNNIKTRLECPDCCH